MHVRVHNPINTRRHNKGSSLTATTNTVIVTLGALSIRIAAHDLKEGFSIERLNDDNDNEDETFKAVVLLGRETMLGENVTVLIPVEENLIPAPVEDP